MDIDSILDIVSEPQFQVLCLNQVRLNLKSWKTSPKRSQIEISSNFSIWLCSITKQEKGNLSFSYYNFMATKTGKNLSFFD